MWGSRGAGPLPGVAEEAGWHLSLLGSQIRCNLAPASPAWLPLCRASLPAPAGWAGGTPPGGTPGPEGCRAAMQAGGWVRWAPREPVIFRGWGRVANCCSRAGNALSSSPSQISCRPDPACFPSPAAREHQALLCPGGWSIRDHLGQGQAGEGVGRAGLRPVLQAGARCTGSPGVPRTGEGDDALWLSHLCSLPRVELRGHGEGLHGAGVPWAPAREGELAGTATPWHPLALDN